MSRGLGRVQRAVVAAFRDSPQAAFAVEELAALAYPGAVITKSMRVAVLRAADAAAAPLGWTAITLAKPGAPVIYARVAGERAAQRRRHQLRPALSRWSWEADARTPHTRAVDSP